MSHSGPCIPGQRRLFIDVNGNFFPCERVSETSDAMKIGDLKNPAFPMSARVVHKMGLQEDPQNFLLMHSIGVNVSGQIASVIAGGMVLNIVMPLVA